MRPLREYPHDIEPDTDEEDDPVSKPLPPIEADGTGTS